MDRSAPSATAASLLPHAVDTPSSVGVLAPMRVTRASTRRGVSIQQIESLQIPSFGSSPMLKHMCVPSSAEQTVETARLDKSREQILHALREGTIVINALLCRLPPFLCAELTPPPSSFGFGCRSGTKPSSRFRNCPHEKRNLRHGFCFKQDLSFRRRLHTPRGRFPSWPGWHRRRLQLGRPSAC